MDATVLFRAFHNGNTDSHIGLWVQKLAVLMVIINKAKLVTLFSARQHRPML